MTHTKLKPNLITYSILLTLPSVWGLVLASSTTPQADPPAVKVVVIQDMQFSPATLEIEHGDVVEWKNEDMIPHTATSSFFDSGAIAAGGSWQYTFTETGSFDYDCTFHPGMHGVVTVK